MKNWALVRFCEMTEAFAVSIHTVSIQDDTQLHLVPASLQRAGHVTTFSQTVGWCISGGTKVYVCGELHEREQACPPWPHGVPCPHTWNNSFCGTFLDSDKNRRPFPLLSPGVFNPQMQLLGW